ncbi:MAG: hypothetical protein ABH872_00645 [Candidatus Omnitrophota bacterium]
MGRRNLFLSIRKSQISVYFIAAIATLIAITFIIIIVGKTAKDKTHSANAADAGALAAASVMANAFNYVADQNDSDKSKRGSMKEEHNRGVSSDQPSQQLKSKLAQDKNYTDEKIAYGSAAGFLSPIALPQDRIIIHEGDVAAQTVSDAERHRKDHDQEMQQKLDAVKRAVDGNQENPDNYYNNALYMGIMINFQNSGIMHRLGDKTRDEYQAFLDEIKPDNVQSGMPYTFPWVDGSARFHMVTAIVEIEPADNWNVRINRDNETKQEEDARKAEADFRNAQQKGVEAQKNRLDGVADPLYDPILHTPPGTVNENEAHSFMDSGKRTYDDWFEGQQEAQNLIIRNSSETQDYTVAYVEDIIHSQTVYSANFQFHMGSPVKSIMFGDIDEITFYPPVQSSAVASFNCTGRGDISRGDANGDAESGFEACLIAAF